MLQAEIKNIAGIQMREMGGYGDTLELNNLRESDAGSSPPSCFSELHLAHYAVGQRRSRERWQLWAEPHETGSTLEPQAGMLDRYPCILWHWANVVRALHPGWASNSSFHPSPKCSPWQPQGQGGSQHFLGWRFLISRDCLHCVHKCTFIHPKPLH